MTRLKQTEAGPEELKYSHPALRVAYHKAYLKQTRHFMGEAMRSASLGYKQPASQRGLTGIVVSVCGL